MDHLRVIFEYLTSQSLAAYIARGALAIGLITLGFMQVGAHPVLGVVLLFAALVPLGGCPTCWIAGTIGAACKYQPPRNLPPRG